MLCRLVVDRYSSTAKEECCNADDQMEASTSTKVSDLDGSAPESTDYANYFCTYAYLYHQVRSPHGRNFLLPASPSSTLAGNDCAAGVSACGGFGAERHVGGSQAYWCILCCNSSE